MKSNLLTGAIIGIVVGFVIGWLVVQGKYQATSMGSPVSQTQKTSSSNESALRMNMRKLWEDHITWTRMYLVSFAYGNDDTQNVAARLLKNQEDIGNAIKPYYGDDAGNNLTTLLKEHITTAVDVVKAAKLGDQDGLGQANDKWYANANSIADFLSNANPNNWPNDQARLMMKDHLDLTKQEAVNILGKKYDLGIADYDKVHDQILIMADMLSEGIIKQYPDKFK